MDEGLIQFLVIAVFVIISVMDGAARKRRKEAQSRGRIPQADSIPEADADLGEGAQSSKGMVPEDLWKEIAALARGEVHGGEVGSVRGPATRDPSGTATRDPGSTRDPSSEEGAWTTPGQELPPNRVSGMDTGERVRWSAGRPARPDAPPPTGTRSGDLQGGYEHPDQAATHQEHAEIASTARQLPAEGPHEPVLHASEPSTAATKASPRRAGASQGLLAGVRRGAKNSLQDAIVLAEVLNPPVTLRDSDREPSF